MRKCIKTKNGLYYYKEKIVYEGVKRIDKSIAKENLLLFRRIAHMVEFKFALGFATFLGAMREHDFIDHDEDTDLVSLSEEKEKFLSMLFLLRENGFELIRFDRRGDLCSIMRNGEYIDVLFFHKFTEDTQIAQFYIWPNRFVLDWRLYDFLGEKFYGPGDWEDFLLFLYGDNWIIPIQRDNYEIPFWKRILIKQFRLIYNNLPNFLFAKVMKKRKMKRVLEYNERVRRFNQIKGFHVFNELPSSN